MGILDSTRQIRLVALHHHHQQRQQQQHQQLEEDAILNHLWVNVIRISPSLDLKVILGFKIS